MTNPKITTFLMCPAANGDASGGTPAANAASGGHIKKSAWVHVFDAASVALFDLLVIASNRGATCHVAEDQEQDVEGEEEVGHGSIAHEVVVDHAQAGDQHDGGANDGDGDEFIEGHGSLLVVRLREQEKDAVSGQAAADKAQDEDEKVHGGSVLKQGAKRPEEAAYCEEAHEAQGGEGGGGHGLCLRAGLGGDRALAAALVQSKQRLAKREARLLCLSGGQVTDRRLLAVANRGDVYLPEVAGPKVGDE